MLTTVIERPIEERDADRKQKGAAELEWLDRRERTRTSRDARSKSFREERIEAHKRLIEHRRLTATVRRPAFALPAFADCFGMLHA